MFDSVDIKLRPASPRVEAGSSGSRRLWVSQMSWSWSYPPPALAYSKIIGSHVYSSWTDFSLQRAGQRREMSFWMVSRCGAEPLPLLSLNSRPRGNGGLLGSAECWPRDEAVRIAPLSLSLSLPAHCRNSQQNPDAPEVTTNVFIAHIPLLEEKLPGVGLRARASDDIFISCWQSAHSPHSWTWFLRPRVCWDDQYHRFCCGVEGTEGPSALRAPWRWSHQRFSPSIASSGGKWLSVFTQMSCSFCGNCNLSITSVFCK